MTGLLSSPFWSRTPPEPPKNLAAIAEYPGSIKDRLRTKKEAKNAPNNDAVQRMVDIAAKRAEGKGQGYEKWATMHNLKQMSATLMLYQQYGFSSPDELDAAISAANTATQESLAGLKGLEAAIREKKELQRNLLGYIGTKPARDGLKAQKSEKAPQSLPGAARKRFYHSGHSRPLFQGAWNHEAASQQSPAKGD